MYVFPLSLLFYNFQTICIYGLAFISMKNLTLMKIILRNALENDVFKLMSALKKEESSLNVAAWIHLQNKFYEDIYAWDKNQYVDICILKNENIYG